LIASIILAHPYRGSFNHAIYARARETLSSRQVAVHAHDLYEEGFDPVLTEGELGKLPTEDPLTRRYSEEFVESELLVFVHPNWWGQPPAILKGYIDRVFRPPQAYDFETGDLGGLAEGRLGGKTGIVFNTSNTEAGREENYFHDPLEYIWKRCVFGFCGITESHRRMFRIVSESSQEERKGWLDEVEALLLLALDARVP